jgi:hypothetical protein
LHVLAEQHAFQAAVAFSTVAFFVFVLFYPRAGVLPEGDEPALAPRQNIFRKIGRSKTRTANIWQRDQHTVDARPDLNFSLEQP